MKPAIAVCLGFGWDSSAMLIEMERRGQRPDLITFADHGGEKTGTYDFVPLLTRWCQDVDFPEPLICQYRPRQKTRDRYRAAVEAMAERMRLSLAPDVLDRLSGIVGNMIANCTLPGIAFGPKSCSVKWKLEAQEFW